jgi:hypothetical protein
MDLNINWKVIALNDKSTYPTAKNKLIHFYITDGVSTYTHILGYYKGDKFVDVNCNIIHFTDKLGNIIPKIFWQYVDYLPNQVVKRSCKKCGKPEDRCEYEDDGYCLAEFGPKKCNKIRYVTEYWAYNK